MSFFEHGDVTELSTDVRSSFCTSPDSVKKECSEHAAFISVVDLVQLDDDGLRQ